MKCKKYNNRDIIKILNSNANKYKQNLLNKNLMFIFKENNLNELSYIEVIFNDFNFLHLTGIKYNKKASIFFKECLNNRISIENIEFKNQIFATLKLEVLENAMNIGKSAKRIGIYNNNKNNVKIERLIGNLHYWIGVSNVKQNNEKMQYYYPKTLIQDNFKKNVIKENKIIATLSKNKDNKLYSEITYLSKNTTLSELKKENQISKKIDYKNLMSKSPQYQERIKKENK